MNLIKILISIIPARQKMVLKKFIYRLRPFIFNIDIDNNLDILTNKINLYFFFFPFKRKKFIREIDFLNHKAKANHPSSFVFPYTFVFDYDLERVKVFKDDKKGLYYVIHKGKRLYYSRGFHSEAEVKNHYHCISIEQDENSPHRYIHENFNVEENDVVIDIGAAEGNFSLEIVERAKTLYIFETDISWIEALNATFEPWKGKVHIINKFISNINNDKCATLDSLLGSVSVNFIKMDVEGSEGLILEGSKKILRDNRSLRLALCTYHNNNDANKIEKTLLKNKFDCSFSNGYMLFIYHKLTPPYFRRGLMRAQKNKI
jgi:phospholipid N-methyltransferase